MPDGNGRDSYGVPLVLRESSRWVPPNRLTSGEDYEEAGYRPVGLLDASISTMPERRQSLTPARTPGLRAPWGLSRKQYERAGGSGETIRIEGQSTDPQQTKREPETNKP